MHENINLAPLTGITIAINWLINNLKLKVGVVKTTRMTTIPVIMRPDGILFLIMAIGAARITAHSDY